VQIAEEAQEASIVVPVQQDLRRGGLRGVPLGLHRRAALIASLEVLAIKG